MDAKVGVPPAGAIAEDNTFFVVLVALSFTHFVNDVIQSLVAAIYPILKVSFALDFGQIGLITLAFQLTASFLQPLIGLYTDRRPRPYSLMIGMGFTVIGLVLLSRAPNFAVLLGAAALVGVGSSVFHPEASRVARLASGGKHGLAQSLFQVGGNAGSAIGPLAAAFVVVPHGQTSIAWFSILAVMAIVVLGITGRWYDRRLVAARGRPRRLPPPHGLAPRHVAVSITILLVLIFSKYFYMTSISSYYTFYLIHKFQVSIQNAQILLFLFLGAAAVGTLLGGPLGDRIGRRYVIWGSILGVLPFTLMLPYANLFFTAVLSVVIGLILSSAFSAILVYAQELVPGKIGAISGLFFGFAFGMAGLGAALLGVLADATSIDFVYRVCAFLPAFGLFACFLPRLGEPSGGS